jgi:galactokinase
MDQMAVAISKPGEVLALDTLSLDYDIIPLPSSISVGVVHSGVSRALADGRYAIRRREILDAARALNVDWLCRGTLDAAERLPEPLRRRARHVISEDVRTRAAAEALRSGDLSALARFVNEGHASIRDDFEITTREVDAVVVSALDCGALAARQTGGGFGGCIVESAKPQGWFDALKARHPGVRRVVPAA